MPSPPDRKPSVGGGQDGRKQGATSRKLGSISGVYVPVFLNIMSILMFLRFGLIIGQVGFIGIIGLLLAAYTVDFLTTLSLSAIASNGEVKGGGAYYLISRSLGPEFGGSIGILFVLAQALNTALNIVGLIGCLRLNVGSKFPQGYWEVYGLQTSALVLTASLCLLGSAAFSRASNALLIILVLAIASVPVSASLKAPFDNPELGVKFTGFSLSTLAGNFMPDTDKRHYNGLETFRDLFGILFPATSGIFAGASMSGDLKTPSHSIPKGTLWAMLTTFITYVLVILSLAASTTRESLLANPNVISVTNLFSPVILAGECAVTLFSALMGILGSAKLFQALARDRLLPGLSVFGTGSKRTDEPVYAILLVYVVAQLALFADLNEIATVISMGYQMTFFVMNLACFLLKIGSAPNFRPGFKFFAWQTALVGSLSSAAAMFFIDETYAAIAICALVLVFLLIHYLCPPKRWGDVSQNLIYHQVRKYLLRLKPEHIKFWRPHIILLINNPRRQTRLIQFCNSMKKGSLYILGHVIVTDDFNAGVHEARLQQQAWSNYISEVSRIKAFVQLTMSPSLTWGIRNLILSAGLGGMRPNIAVLGFYNMDDLRKSHPTIHVPEIPATVASKMRRPAAKPENRSSQRKRSDTSARLLEGFLPTDVIRTEGIMSPTDYMTILEDLALRYRLNVAVAYGFDKLETPRKDGDNNKQYIDLWPIQMSAEVSADGKNVLTTNFDTYTLILQLGHILRSVQTWREAYSLRVMVFVEYESEVEEESARVKALLEKLRIDAHVKVFWLASGQLQTYELIINGSCSSIDWDILVNDALRDEGWWDDLQTLRGQSENLSASQEIRGLAHIIDSTLGRPGMYKPHEDNDLSHRRRSSVPNLDGMPELPKNPAIATLSRLGVNPGIHTHRLGDEVFQESDSGREYSSDSEGSDEDFGYDLEQTASRQNHPPVGAVNQPLLSSSKGSRKQKGHSKSGSEGSSVRAGRSRKDMPLFDTALSTRSYGTMIRDGDTRTPLAASEAADKRPEAIGDKSHEPPHPFAGETSDAPQASRTRSQSTSPSRIRDAQSLPAIPRTPTRPTMSHQGSGAGVSNRLGSRASAAPEAEPAKVTFATPAPIGSKAERPAFSRQSSQSKFSSRPLPETKVETEGETPKMSFVGRAADERPTHSRQSSYGRFSSRPMPESRVQNGEDGSSRTIEFAEQSMRTSRSAANSRSHSRQGSGHGDLSLKIPELLDTYRFGGEPLSGAATTMTTTTPDTGSAYSTQSISLSFNDLPSRAQHLVLNELIQQNSGDTAVILSTLPIPSEGTDLDEVASMQYLSDVEVLCNELPPVMMVLSNSMTVTVSL